jgi:hypothetical protein
MAIHNISLLAKGHWDVGMWLSRHHLLVLFTFNKHGGQRLRWQTKNQKHH